MTPLRRAPRLWAHASGGFVERKYLLAEASQGDGRGNGGQLEVAQDAGNYRLLVKVARLGATASAQRVCALPSATQ
jgi:hypothetical protein